MNDPHFPDNIKMEPVYKCSEDFKPDIIVLGGDIIDAKGLHNSQCLKAEDIDVGWYKRDVALLQDFIKCLPKCKIVFLEGNHEERYKRVINKYPQIFTGMFDFKRDALPKGTEYIPYGNYEAFYKLGDAIFTHGTIYPDAHAKQYAYRYAPYKVIYGHLHDHQVYSTHRALTSEHFRYAVTPGCLCQTNPEWKQGSANRWINGFITFVSDGVTTTPEVHMIENGKLFFNGKLYK